MGRLWHVPQILASAASYPTRSDRVQGVDLCSSFNTIVAMANRAVFLDRDGVINANIVSDGKPYAPRTIEAFRLLPGVEEAVQRIKAAGFLAIVATNQPDVAAGLTPRATVDAMHAKLRQALPLDDIKV